MTLWNGILAIFGKDAASRELDEKFRATLEETRCSTSELDAVRMKLKEAQKLVHDRALSFSYRPGADSVPDKGCRSQEVKPG